MNDGRVSIEGPGVLLEVVDDVWLVRKWRTSGIAFRSYPEAEEWASEHGGKITYQPIWKYTRIGVSHDPPSA